LLVVIVANLINLLLALMFLFRAQRRPGLGGFFGWVAVALSIPLAGAAAFNGLNQREWWAVALPLPMILYAIAEFILDGVLKSNFRQTALLGPYLGLYYLGLMMLIGYAFLAGRPYGFVTLITYFINLAATAYSYNRVGHG
jgi:hypothetical protein